MRFLSNLSPKTISLDRLNILLIFASLLLAYMVPFELFLFSYAFLGPLHYLTEINWLKQRNFFTKQPYDYILLVIFTLLIFIGFTSLILLPVVLVFAAIAVFFASMKARVIGVLAGILLVMPLFISLPVSITGAITVLLPTVIHVFIFTAAFMLYGALKSNSRDGLLSVFLLFAAACLIFFFTPEGRTYNSPFILDSFASFAGVSSELSNILGAGYLTIQEVFNSQIGLTIARFLAFAYTYHYLNWFSKTSIIGWHKSSKPVLVSIIVLWVASVILYAIDYKLGLRWLFLLSFGHVLLELPLNFSSFKGIFTELKRRLI